MVASLVLWLGVRATILAWRPRASRHRHYHYSRDGHQPRFSSSRSQIGDMLMRHFDLAARAARTEEDVSTRNLWTNMNIQRCEPRLQGAILMQQLITHLHHVEATYMIPDTLSSRERGEDQETSTVQRISSQCRGTLVAILAIVTEGCRMRTSSGRIEHELELRNFTSANHWTLTSVLPPTCIRHSSHCIMHFSHGARRTSGKNWRFCMTCRTCPRPCACHVHL